MIQSNILRNYWWLGLLGGGFVTASAYVFGGEDRIALTGAAIAATLGFYYFMQQQKLAETQLFYALFSTFNERYDEYNGPLAELAAKATPWSSSDRDLVVDYFNLCAEEYLFFKEGYIHHEVWQSWCRGMLWYLRLDSFRKLLDEEVKTESLYGLTFEAIEQGASWHRN